MTWPAASIARCTVVASLAVLLALPGCKRKNDYVPPPPPKVTVAPPLQQHVTSYLDATGNTVAYNQVDLVARVSGFLQDIRYKDGAIVHRGDTLFVIEPEPYKAKLQQAKASLDSAQAQQTQAVAEFNRQASLGRSDFSSQSTVQQAQATADSARANVVSEQAAVTLAAINLGYTQVTAPFDGIVTAHQVSVGSLVGASGPTQLATIIQLDPIYVSFTVSEQDVLRIRANLHRRGLDETRLSKVPVEIGLMTEQGYPHKGTLDYASPQVDTATGTMTVRGVLPNADHALLPGFFVRVRVPLPQAQPAVESLLVPDTALGADQAGRYLLVVDKNDVVQQRTVTAGQTVGDLRVITSGLKPDDRVVISGIQHAVPGNKVNPQSSTITSAALTTVATP